MATVRKSTTQSTSPREVYATPDRRVVVVRFGPQDYGLLTDGSLNSCYTSQAVAEVQGGVWLHEQADAVCVEDADAAAFCAEWDQAVLNERVELERYATEWDQRIATARFARRSYALGMEPTQ